ncbi:hypothetical protein J6590_079302 [Homalodisca vitripennis]|nr:hypothetical protein J6590_079302 [Homalodisca vitripennis]
MSMGLHFKPVSPSYFGFSKKDSQLHRGNAFDFQEMLITNHCRTFPLCKVIAIARTRSADVSGILNYSISILPKYLENLSYRMHKVPIRCHPTSSLSSKFLVPGNIRSLGDYYPKKAGISKAPNVVKLHTSKRLRLLGTLDLRTRSLSDVTLPAPCPQNCAGERLQHLVVVIKLLKSLGLEHPGAFHPVLSALLAVPYLLSEQENTDLWSEGLRFHRLKRTPSEALFGFKVKADLKTFICLEILQILLTVKNIRKLVVICKKPKNADQQILYLYSKPTSHKFMKSPQIYLPKNSCRPKSFKHSKNV